VSLVSFVEKHHPSNPSLGAEPADSSTPPGLFSYSRGNTGYPLKSLRDTGSSQEERLRRVEEQHRYRPQLELGLGKDPSVKVRGRYGEE
jgi:hypothetical protein